MKNKVYVSPNYKSTTLAVVIINGILAVTALAKDMFLASYLGTTSYADAMLLAFFITDMIGNNLLANAATNSCIPLFSRDREGGSCQRSAVLKVNLIFFIISSAAACVLYMNSGTAAVIMGRGFDKNTLSISADLLRILSPSILLYPIAYVGISLLQVRGRFKTSAIVPVIFNMFLLLGILYCFIQKVPVEKGVYLLSWVIIVSIIGMMAVAYFPVKSIRREPALGSALQQNIGVLEVIKLFMPYIAILFISQFNLYLERYFASIISTGSVAALNYAFRLAQFPVWVFTAALGTVMFPRMSRYNSEGNREKINRVFVDALRSITVVTIPMSIILFMFGEPVVSILFLRGAFDKGSMSLTLSLLRGYSLGILGQSIIYISLKYYLSIKKVLKPFLIMAAAGLINLLFDICFVKRMGIGALGYGSAISAVFSAFMMIICTDIDITERFSKKLSLLYRVVAANLPIVLILIPAVSIWQRHIVQNSFVSRAFYGFAVLIICLLTYIFLLKKHGIADMSNLGRGKVNVKGAVNNTSL